MTGPSSELVDRVANRLLRAGAAPTTGNVMAALRAERTVLDATGALDVVDAVRRELVGAGPLDRLLADRSVTDVLVNAADDVWVDRGAGLEPADVTFADDDAVRRLAQRLAAAAGRRLDTSCPAVDARLPGGVRLHAVLPPVSPAGPVLCLRVSGRRVFSLGELEAAGTLVPAMTDALVGLVQSGQSFLVTGGTGSGKTTLLATLLSLVPPEQRLVLVEDSGELVPDHPHVVRLEARTANAEGAGRVSLRDLVRHALRMRPDRLVVGEVRGAEVVDLLGALNTGHEGGCGTVHAGSPEHLPARMEALGLAAGLTRDALHSQLVAGVQAVVHLTRGRDGVRRVTALASVARGDRDRAEVRRALTVDRDGVHPGPATAVLRVGWQP